MPSPLLYKLASEYSSSRGMLLDELLGDGTDGAVWSTDRNTVVKAVQRQTNYRMELACYQRLREYDVASVLQFAIPRLIDSDDQRQIIEMTWVSPPFLLDFGKAYLDNPPDFSAEVNADELEKQRENWGDQFHIVSAAIGFLRHNYGIHYGDPNKNNIKFGSE